MPDTQKLSPSLEDYLEAIYSILQKENQAKASVIGAIIGVNRPSVTGALKVLGERGLINYAPYEKITLTAAGEKIAKGILRRHQLLKSFMTDILFVTEEEAQEAACQMEHAITPHILQKFVSYMNFMEESVEKGADWQLMFREYLQNEQE